MTTPAITTTADRPTIRVTKVFTQAMFDAFARLSGDDNPIHVDPEFASGTRFGRPVAHGMFLYSVLCGVLHDQFPGAIQLSQSMIFPNPTYAGEPVTIELTAGDPLDERQTIQVRFVRADGRTTLEGEAVLQGGQA